MAKIQYGVKPDFFKNASGPATGRGGWGAARPEGGGGPGEGGVRPRLPLLRGPPWPRGRGLFRPGRSDPARGGARHGYGGGGEGSGPGRGGPARGKGREGSCPEEGRGVPPVGGGVVRPGSGQGFRRGEGGS